jgi:hypothetical protein
MHAFSQTLYGAMSDNPLRKIVMFKSVASAFLNLPAHPLWQIHQIVIVDRIAHIVHHLVFGSRGSPHTWCLVSGLLCWLAIKKFEILGLHVYMDDFFGWDFEDNCIWFHNQLQP